MNDKPIPPHVFSNRVIKQMIEHAFGEDMEVDYKDYHALRVAFRSGGGKWDEIGKGNIVHINLLAKMISAWGQMPGRTRSGDKVI